MNSGSGRFGMSSARLTANIPTTITRVRQLIILVHPPGLWIASIRLTPTKVYTTLNIYFSARYWLTRNRANPEEA